MFLNKIYRFPCLLCNRPFLKISNTGIYLISKRDSFVEKLLSYNQKLEKYQNLFILLEAEYITHQEGSHIRR